MPTGTNQTFQQDWGAVNVGRASRPSAKTKVGVAKRHGAGGNASAHSGGIMSARKVRCDEAFDATRQGGDLGFRWMVWVFRIACQIKENEGSHK